MGVELHLENITSLVDKSLAISLRRNTRSCTLPSPPADPADAHESLSGFVRQKRLQAATLASPRPRRRGVSENCQDRTRSLAWPEFVSELDNFRACFDLVSGTSAMPAALQLAVALERYWISNSAVEGLQLLEVALAVI